MTPRRRAHTDAIELPRSTTLPLATMLLFTLVLPLAACSSDPQGSASGAIASVVPSPTPPPVDPVIAWADGVCGAAFGIRDNVEAIGEDLAFDPAAAATAGDQIRANLDARSEAVGRAVEDLGTQIGRVPADVSDAVALATDFEAQFASLQRSIDEARGSLAALTSSNDVISFGINAAAAIGAVRAASESTAALAAAIGEATSGAQGSASDAFAASEVCLALTSGGARPSGSPSG